MTHYRGHDTFFKSTGSLLWAPAQPGWKVSSPLQQTSTRWQEQQLNPGSPGAGQGVVSQTLPTTGSAWCSTHGTVPGDRGARAVWTPEGRVGPSGPSGVVGGGGTC